MALRPHSITPAEAVALAAEGRLQLVDATWTLAGSDTNLAEPFDHTTSVLDTAAIKTIPVNDRTPMALETVFRDSGIGSSRPIAVYDRAGLFSSPWAWWMLGELGLQSFVVEDTSETAGKVAHHLAFRGQDLANTARLDDVLAAIDTATQIVDARSPGRFTGIDPEPRPGMRSGHIPGSINLPFGHVKSGDRFKPESEIADAVRDAGIDLTRPILTSCGSGVTASGLAFALKRAGATDVRVYMGSWAEYGASDHLVETGP